MRTFIVMLLCAVANAGEVKLAWDAQSGVTDYRIWKGIECLATVGTNSATLTLPDAPAVITVTARNAAGESPHSEPLEIIAVTLQRSPDLKGWSDSVTKHFEKRAKDFFRVKVETEGAP